jgi:hypothetical protein
MNNKITKNSLPFSDPTGDADGYLEDISIHYLDCPDRRIAGYPVETSSDVPVPLSTYCRLLSIYYFIAYTEMGTLYCSTRFNTKFHDFIISANSDFYLEK